MKNQFLSFCAILAIAISMAACGSKSGSTQPDPAATEQMATDTSSTPEKSLAIVYQCPMKCEGEKTYDKPGKCPKCSMDLKEKDEHEGHEH
jgi:predicted small lipoprotein YifL